MVERFLDIYSEEGQKKECTEVTMVLEVRESLGAKRSVNTRLFAEMEGKLFCWQRRYGLQWRERSSRRRARRRIRRRREKGRGEEEEEEGRK